MNREEFIRLFEKHLSGQASLAEQEQLRSLNDEMQLEDDSWEKDLGDQAELYQEISNSVNNSIARLDRRKRFLTYSYRIAASILLFLAAGIIWKTTRTAREPIASIKKETVVPATDQACLTLSSGRKILLDTGRNSVNTEFGIKLEKAKDGLLVYNISGASIKIPSDQTLYHTISTPRGGRYSIILSDSTKVWLNASSSIRFPLTFNGNQRKVEITGEAYFEVAKNKAKPFIVKASDSEVKVLGTHFNVSVYAEDGFVKTTLLEGSVKFEHKGESSVLKPGYAAISKVGEKGVTTREADVMEAVSWKNGLFIFHDENIAEVMKKVSRWYDVDVEIQDNVKDKEFGGSISRFKDITEILEMMELAGGINYKIEGRRVTIMN